MGSEFDANNPLYQNAQNTSVETEVPYEVWEYSELDDVKETRLEEDMSISEPTPSAPTLPEDTLGLHEPTPIKKPTDIPGQRLHNRADKQNVQAPVYSISMGLFFPQDTLQALHNIRRKNNGFCIA